MALADGDAQNQWLFEHRDRLLGVARAAATQMGAQTPVAA
jgi:hypothetical protein